MHDPRISSSTRPSLSRPEVGVPNPQSSSHTSLGSPNTANPTRNFPFHSDERSIPTPQSLTSRSAPSTSGSGLSAAQSQRTLKMSSTSLSPQFTPGADKRRVREGEGGEGGKIENVLNKITYKRRGGGDYGGSPDRI